MIRLRVLGSVDLADPRGAELTAVLAQPKRLAILVYLVVSPGFHRRDALLAMFWPELDTRRARASLNQAVGFLRKELGGRPESVIVSRGGAELGINSDGIWCDVSAFRVYIQAERYSEALDLYPGDLLPGFHSVPSSEFHEWLENERVRLRTTAVRAAREVAQVNERARHYTTAVTSARRAVELSGLDERAVRDLLTLLDRLGDRAGAINAYDEFARHLATELEAEPSAETVALVEQIRHRAVFPETSNMPQQLGPGVELNGWRVIRELERGGMATVHLALDVKHDRHVAIKELRREKLSSWLEAERFLREIQITARFAHPHILPLIDSGSRNGVPYLVTPYVAGESLRARLAREGRLTPDEALRLATETAKALDYAHRHGIIHCDIKPENILLADGHAVVADFGIARAVAASDSREFVAKESEVVLGSPPYMSPELLERGPVGPTTDVYALGCVLVEMLTGAPPNPGENSSDLAESLGPGIAQLTTDCIAVNPRNRPQSAAELIRRLEILTRPTTDRPSLEGVLQQRPDRTAHRTRRRHAITWSMGALVALATLWLTTPWFGLGRSLISRGKVNAGDALLVADFKTTGPDSGVGSALAGAMRESLRESRVITLASAPAIGAGLQRMRRSRASTLDAATAVELAQRIGVKAVVTGSVTPLRSGYLVTAELIAAFSGDELAAFQESAGASDSLIPAVDRLARRLRVTIGESLKSISADPPLAQVTTASLNALKKYTEANQANAIEGDYPKAVRLLKEAVALDSTFGSAYRDLAVTTLNSGVHEEEAPEFEEKAYQLRDRMTERERLVTVASYYGSGGPHPDARKSLDGLTVVVDRYPEMGNFLNQGIAYREVRDFAREDSAYRHAIAASGGVVGGAFKYFNLVRAELNLGHISGAREALRVAAARFPGDARIEQEKRNIAYAEGNADSARAACQRALAAKLTQARLEANKCLANLALREGRVAQAGRYRRAADALRDSLGQPADSVGDLLFAAELNARVYQRPDATLRILDGAASALLKAEMEPRGRRPQATRSSSTAVYSPPPLLRAAALFAMVGSADRAAALLGQYDRESIDTVSRRLEEAARHEALGWIDLNRRQPLAAVAEFRRADTVSGAPASACRICIDLNLAEAFQRANLLDSAIAALEHYVNTPDAYRLQLDAIDLAPTLRRLGALYAAKGDRARAAAYDRRFVELWKNADPDLQPQVIETRRFVAELSRMEHPASGNRSPRPPRANKR